MFQIDTTTPFGQRVEKHLSDDAIVWLTSVAGDGSPQPRPVWFLREDHRVTVYSAPAKPKLRHIQRNRHVSLNFGGDGSGGDIVVLSGEARVEEPASTPSLPDAYARKYASLMERMSLTAAAFAAAYSVPITITLTGLRGH